MEHTLDGELYLQGEERLSKAPATAEASSDLHSEKALSGSTQWRARTRHGADLSSGGGRHAGGGRKSLWEQRPWTCSSPTLVH